MLIVGKGCAYVGQRLYGKSLYPPAQFCSELKIALKNKAYFSKTLNLKKG